LQKMSTFDPGCSERVNIMRADCSVSMSLGVGVRRVGLRGTKGLRFRMGIWDV
jgi:hypothetical protein